MADGDRVHTDSILWVFCCCGCLPIIGIFKMFINIPMSLLIMVPGNVVISILLLPLHTYRVYYSIVATPKWGPNLKVLAMLLTPVPIALWPFIVTVGSTIFAIVLGVGYSLGPTFDSDYHLLYGGIHTCAVELFNASQQFWQFEYNGFASILDRFRDPLLDGEVPFDIRIIDIIAGMYICCIALLIDVPCIVLLVLVYAIPILIHVYALYLQQIWEMLFGDLLFMCACFPFIIAIFFLIPVVWLLLCSLLCVCTIACGPAAAVVAYNDGIPEAKSQIFAWIQEAQEQLHWLAFF